MLVVTAPFVLQDDFEDFSDDEVPEDEINSYLASLSQNPHFLQQQLQLVSEEDQFLQSALDRFASTDSWVAELKFYTNMKSFKSPHVFLTDRLDASHFDDVKRQSACIAHVLEVF